MKFTPAPAITAIQWLPAERLGPLNVDANVRPCLDETRDGLSDFERSADEYAWLPSDDQLTARALREAQVKPAGLWARRTRVALRGAPLLMQEVFLPAMGHP
jgi:hypothetical protein